MLDSLVALVTFRGTWTIEEKKRCLASLSVVEIRDIFCFAASEASYNQTQLSSPRYFELENSNKYAI